MAKTGDEIPDAGLNFATRPRLLSWNQKQLRALAREGEERAFIDLTTADLNHAVSQNIPQNWLLEGKCWLRWTFGTEVYHLDPDRYLDLRDWSDPQLERLLQQLRDGEVLVEAVNDKEIAVATSVNDLHVSGLDSSKASQKRYRATDRLKERLIQTIGTCHRSSTNYCIRICASYQFAMGSNVNRSKDFAHFKLRLHHSVCLG